VTLWQVNLPCESLQKNFLTCDNYDSVIYGRALSGKELPQQSEISGITPKVLVRTDVAGAPGKIEIVSRNTYQPGAELRRHYHTSQIVFYILEGSMGVQEDGKEPVTLKPGDTLLIKPGTVHRHWNVSRTEPLVFTEFIFVDEGQRSAVFVE
jgi:quercetin dioxygenase-like cupin family protein